MQILKLFRHQSEVHPFNLALREGSLDKEITCLIPIHYNQKVCFALPHVVAALTAHHDLGSLENLDFELDDFLLLH